VRACTPAARAKRPKKFVQQLVNEPQVKHQECSSSTAIVLICAEIYALANRTEFWNQRIGDAFPLVSSNLEGDKQMLKRILIVTILALIVTLSAVASDREDDVNRTNKAAQVFQEIMNTPDQGIPSDLLKSAKCIAIIPGDVKFAFVFGGNYGRGLATCRTGHGWSAPMFVAIEGGSVGYQIGGSSTDIVMLFMNDHALQSLLSDKFKLGADASVAAGPVGRRAAAGTDLKLSAEILSYSRAKGLFAGVSLDGAVVQADKSGDKAMYGDDVDRHEILNGKVAVPASARPLLHEIGVSAR
jgi:lipid-binding SYLF domain-containing protein